MKQHQLTIIAVLAAIIIALSSMDTVNNQQTQSRSHNVFQFGYQYVSDNLPLPVSETGNTQSLLGQDNPQGLTVFAKNGETVSPAETQHFAFLHHTAMTELSPVHLPPLDAGMVNVTGGSEPDEESWTSHQAGGYRMESPSLQSGAIALSIPYDPSLLPQGFTEDDIQTYVYDRHYRRWVAIQRDSVNEAEMLVYSRFVRNPLAETLHTASLQGEMEDMMSFAPQGEGGGDSPLDFINAVLKTPEMPETSAYTPTSIKELKAADPLEGLALVQPPTANNNGTANLSYPIEIPAGRQGMQPNLVLTYSSGGGNGWLGVGWDLPIPSITVETRWGVPRYRSAWESEVYVYEGEQLVTKNGNGSFREMAHRTNDTASIQRLSGNVRHYPRRNEVFDSIVRHGGGPSDYWWSVTHKNGVTDYYGKRHNSDAVDYNSVLCDPTSHHIAQWMLTESVDPHGNWVRYHYHKESRKSLVNVCEANNGTRVYLDSVQYTGHDLSTPKYTVRFHLSGDTRRDIVTNARYGFREVTASTLCNVEVLYQDTVLRKYYFLTENNRESNYKTRLTDLVRMDSPTDEIGCDDILNPIFWNSANPVAGDMEGPGHKINTVRYSFDYYDYPGQDSLYSGIKTVGGLPDDGIVSAFSDENHPATALGATRGYGYNGGGTLTVGVANKDLVITDFNVGGNFNYGQSFTEGLLTLIDLDGDGLADKVYKRGGGVYYRPQVKNDVDSLLFHFGAPVPVRGIYEFLSEESHQPSFGLQGSVMAVVAASAGLPSTVSTTSTYFTDINGDGLPDLVTEQGALFNSLDTNGHPYFTPVNSYRTDPDNGEVDLGQMIVTSATSPCGGIIFDGQTDPNLDCDYLYIRDSVRYYGLPDTCSNILALLADSTVVPIGFFNRWFYFYHVGSVSTHCGPFVTDPDLDAVRVWVAPFDGHVTVNSSIRMLPDSSAAYKQSRYADGVRYTLEKKGRCQADSASMLLALTDTVAIAGSLDLSDTLFRDETYTDSVKRYDMLFFRLQSKQDRSYDNVEWEVDIEYDNESGLDEYGKAKDSYSSSEDFVLAGRHYFQAPKRGTVTLTGALTGNPGANAARLYIAHGVYKDSLDIAANTANDISLNKSFTLEAGDSVVLEIKRVGSGNVVWGGIECRPFLTFKEDTSDHSLSIPDTLSCFPPVRMGIVYADTTWQARTLRKYFGPLYRGWGQFAYKNDSISVNQPIDLASLRLPAYLADPTYVLDSNTIASALDTSQFYLDTASYTTNITVASLSAAFDSIFNPLSDSTRWVEMNPDMEHYCWAGFGNTTSISRTRMSNTRHKRKVPALDGDNYPTDMTATVEIPEYDHPVPVSVNGYPVQTIRKRNISVMGNGSLSLIGSDDDGSQMLSMGGSVSGGSNYVTSDYLDLNGDRYPDMLCKKSVQYTMPWGGIGTLQTLNVEDDRLCNSNTCSGGGTFSGSYPMPKRQAGGNAQKAKISIEGLGGSLMDGTDGTSVMYLDINGDGLPDRVDEGGYVALNTGYGFEMKEKWGTNSPRKGSSANLSASQGVNFSVEQISIGGGMGRNQSENVTETQLVDFNGDGLPDKVSKAGGVLRVSYNFGNGGWSPEDTVAAVSQIGLSHSFTETGNGSLTLGFEIEPFVKIQAGGQLSPYNSSFSHDNAQLTDIDGDGYPDYVNSDSETSMWIRYNRAGKTNLLKTVTNFTGSAITLDYDMPLSCYEKPQRGWNLASVEVNDPASPLPAARTLTRFAYADPHYNRYERMDYGYARVTTSQYDTDGGDSLYRYTVEEFENRSFTKRGRRLRDCVYGSNHRPYVEHLYFATVYDHDDSATVDTGCARSDLYVGHLAELTLYYEGDTVPKIVSRVDKKYDRYRNVILYTHYGDTTHHEEYFTAGIDYASGFSHNLVSLPVQIVVKDYNGIIMQKRSATYHPTGKLQRLERSCSSSTYAQYDFIYDSLGNMVHSTLPENHNNQRLEFSYLYDSVTRTYPVRVENLSLGYPSTASYDLKYGKPTRTVDINGNEMRYTYDYMGRLSTILAPYEADSGWQYTVRMTYVPKNYNRLDIFTPNATQSYACTFHHDPAHPANDLRTVVLSDGLGRMLQTRKDADIGGQERCLVTGMTVYDCFGRTTAQYHPFVEPLGTENVYNDSVTAGTATITRYDILDRQTYTENPMHHVTTLAYGFDTCGGHRRFSTVVTDPMNNSVNTLTGTLGQRLKQVAPGNTVTRFSYDCLGRLKRSTDPDGLITSYLYDWFGQLIQRIHPDAGNDIYYYDLAGNLTMHKNAAGETVKYNYHYNQLMDVSCPQYPANNVHYTYGSYSNSNLSINAVGKVVFQEDASGWQLFKYGKLGELTENIRTFALPYDNHSYTFKMKYRYDSYNRIRTMTYPDGEVVSYGYNLGGLLESVTGDKNGVAYRYIDSIAYNAFELRDSVAYGNGSRVRYEYDSIQRLSRLQSVSAGEVMQDVSYTFDAAGNITRLQNTAAMLGGGLGGSYECDYTYDNNYRLTGADGGWDGADQLEYHVEMDYHKNGRVHGKAVEIVDLGAGTTISQYTNSYHYLPNSNKLTGIDNGSTQIFSWDAKGNMNKHENTDIMLSRYLCWDEQNRLQGVVDEGHLSFYQYDANGDRTFKQTGKGELQNINGSWQYFYVLENPTLYASPYVVATPKGYTKHYYAESERIASKIGGGGLSDIKTPVRQAAVARKVAVNSEMLDKVFLNCLGVRQYSVGADLRTLYDWIDSLRPEDDCYWYHPDHLGSSSWVTDTGGHAVQHLHYLPWGEDLVNQRSTTWNAMYTFSAKEKDAETGYSYFGARYYNSDLSIWLSVDPMSDKYAYQSGYVYCGNNPIKMIDPNGEDEWEFDECGVLKNVIVNNDADIVHIVNENGTRIATSERFAYGTLFNEEDDAAYENDYFPSLTLFQVSDFESTEAIYKFLADNTSVEWGNVLAEDGERNCLFFIGTNHNESSTNIRKTIFERGYTIDRAVHNHPSGNPELSEGDHKGAEAAITNNPCIQLYLYVTPLLNLKRYDRGTPYWNNEGVLQIPVNKQ